MNLNETLQEALEAFEGDMRKLDELISQLELWSDECTVNHKKEEVRLPQYMELHLNLEEMKQQLSEEMKALEKEEGLQQKMQEAAEHMQAQLDKYKETEDMIHDWIKEIKNLYVLIHQSKILQEHQSYILSIVGQ